LGPGSVCDPNPCPQPPLGACCFADGTCQIRGEELCERDHGIWHGEGSDCDPSPCPAVPTGACCFEDGTCQTVTQLTCQSLRGSYIGHTTRCEVEGICTLACCIDHETCVVATKDECEAMHPVFIWNYGSNCDDGSNICGESPTKQTTWGAVRMMFR